MTHPLARERQVYDGLDPECSLEVRPLQPCDARDVQVVLAEAWEERYVRPRLMPRTMLEGFVRPDNSAYVGRQAGRIAAALTEQHAGELTAARYIGVQPTDSHVLEGFVKYYLRPNRMPHSKPGDAPSEHELYIESFNILPENQHRARGTLLLYCVAQAAEQAGVTNISLDVVMRNVLARMFYYRCGFSGEEPLSAFPGSGKWPPLNRMHQRADTAEVIRSTRERLVSKGLKQQNNP